MFDALLHIINGRFYIGRVRRHFRPEDAARAVGLQVFQMVLGQRLPRAFHSGRRRRIRRGDYASFHSNYLNLIETIKSRLLSEVNEHFFFVSVG